MRNIKINKKINLLKLITILLFLIITVRITDIQIFKNDYYIDKYKDTYKYVYSLTAPRGRIYDRNGILLVDNEKINVIRYSNINIKTSDEEKIALKVSKILNEDKNEILKRMRSGYSFDLKTIKENPSAEELKQISELKYDCLIIDFEWVRSYKTKYFLKMFGTVGNIPYEKKDYYLKEGYSLNDKVGISYIEEAYDEILKGKKDKYILKNNKYILVNEAVNGNDIYLTIDIKLQEKVEKILESEIKKAKKEPNTKYYDHSFVIVSNPNTGEILAMAGKKIVDNKFVDITPEILTTTIQGGSSVKGASQIVGYQTGALKIGEIRRDFCIKLKNMNAKCSWKSLGLINDLEALKYSSNSYQYQTAIKLGQGKYSYNKILKLNPQSLKKYRDIFKEFGLGVKTGIDFFESTGYSGNKSNSELILDYAVGQYDTFTPIQFSQYINTIANGGNRLKPKLLKSYNLKNMNILTKVKSLNSLTVEKEYLDRVKKGLKMVMEPGGTGFSYIPSKYKAAGKTGTSTSYLDLNHDGIVETPATSNIFVGYAPYDNPVVSFTVISPNVKLAYTNSTYKTAVNRKITYEVAKNFFEIYK